MTDETRWHWDKRVPIAVIVTLVLQTTGLISLGSWWASNISGRVTTLERGFTPPDTSRIVKVETQIENIMRLMGRIEDKLDRVLDKP